MDEFEIVSQGDGEYRVRVDSRDGSTSLTVLLGDAEEASDGRLSDDARTARAVIQFLLRHQDASDLPGRIEIEDVMAAYSDVVDEVEASRD